jgi:hypothetical protein
LSSTIVYTVALFSKRAGFVRVVALEWELETLAMLLPLTTLSNVFFAQGIAQRKGRGLPGG